MGEYEWRKWLRVEGFADDNPRPGPDLGYDGQALDIVGLDDANTGQFDYWWRMPETDDAWVFVVEEIVIEDLEAWA